jgi:glutamine cyclotransferase
MRRGRLLQLMAVCAALVPLLLAANAQQCSVGANGPQLYGYSIVAEFPHDARAFTQGLQHDTVCEANACRDVFWESTGGYARCVGAGQTL